MEVEAVVVVVWESKTTADFGALDVLLVSIGITVNPSKIEDVAVLIRADDSAVGAWPVMVKVGLPEVEVTKLDAEVEVEVVISEGGGTTIVCDIDTSEVGTVAESVTDVEKLDEMSGALVVDVDMVAVRTDEEVNVDMGMDERPGVKPSLVRLVLVELTRETGIEPRPRLEIVSVVRIVLAEIVLAKPNEKLAAIDDSTSVDCVLETEIELNPTGRLVELPIPEVVSSTVELDWFCCAPGKLLDTLVVVLTLGVRVV